MNSLKRKIKPRKIKPKKCKSCKVSFTPFLSTAKVCSVECSIKLIRYEVKKDADKQVEITQKKWNKEKKEFKANDRTAQLKLTQAVFNKLRRMQELKWFSDRGLEPECISCGKNNMDWCCGHFKTVGSSPALRFDENNTKLQCNRYCNMGLSGNIDGNKTSRGYKQGLRDRFGENEGQKIIDYCNSPHKSNPTCEELINMRKSFSEKIRELESLTS